MLCIMTWLGDALVVCEYYCSSIRWPQCEEYIDKRIPDIQVLCRLGPAAMGYCSPSNSPASEYRYPSKPSLMKLLAHERDLRQSHKRRIILLVHPSKRRVAHWSRPLDGNRLPIRIRTKHHNNRDDRVQDMAAAPPFG